MQRYAFTMRVRPERLDDYLRAHEHVWPSVLEAIRCSGISRYSIFRRGYELFFYMEAEDVTAAMRYVDQDPEHARWNREVTAGTFEGALDVAAPTQLPEVFRFPADSRE